MKYFVVAIILNAVGLLLSASLAKAQTTPECNEIYNSSGACQLSNVIDVTKQVQNPQTNEFVDVLNPSEARIAPDQNAVFRITVTNRSSSALRNINLTDIIPTSLTFVGTQKGEFNEANRTLSYFIESLEEGASESFEVQTRVVPASELPSSGIVCLTNLATVKTGRETTTDNVQFCVGAGQSGSGSSDQKSGSNAAPGSTSTTSVPATSKGGKEVHGAFTPTVSPSTGPELLALLPLLPAAIGGYYIRRRTNHKS